MTINETTLQIIECLAAIMSFLVYAMSQAKDESALKISPWVCLAVQGLWVVVCVQKDLPFLFVLSLAFAVVSVESIWRNWEQKRSML